MDVSIILIRKAVFVIQKKNSFKYNCALYNFVVRIFFRLSPLIGAMSVKNVQTRGQANL